MGTHQVWVDILLEEIEYEGMIRKEDVRSGMLEDIHMYACFRPGDVVVSRVLSLGDSRRYYLSTCESSLGVVRAVCESSGYVMCPVSEREMECTVSGVRELRKCAKRDDMDTS